MVRVILTVIIACSLCSGADIVGDFPITNTNPNGPWSYGVSTAANPFAAFTAGYFNNDTGHGWPPGGVPSIYLPEVEDLGVAHQDPNWLSLLPMGMTMSAVVRWTAPAAGTATLRGAFRLQYQDQSGNEGGVLVYVRHNNSNDLMSANLLTYHQEASISLAPTVAAGDTLDFVVDPNGMYMGDWTGLQGSVFLTEGQGGGEVPEPATVLGVMAGLAALVVARRRFR